MMLGTDWEFARRAGFSNEKCAHSVRGQIFPAMKTLLLTLALALPAFAQEPKPEDKPAPEKPKAELPALPAPDAESDLLKGQPGGRLKPAPSLLPDDVPEPAKRNAQTRPRTVLKPPTTSVDLDLRIRYREARNRAASEQTVQTAWEDSRTAKTDFEKREAMKRYYTALYKKMLALDKAIAPLVTERERVALRRLDQTRIEPTDPLEENHRWRND